MTEHLQGQESELSILDEQAKRIRERFCEAINVKNPSSTREVGTERDELLAELEQIRGTINKDTIDQHQSDLWRQYHIAITYYRALQTHDCFAELYDEAVEDFYVILGNLDGTDQYEKWKLKMRGHVYVS